MNKLHKSSVNAQSQRMAILSWLKGSTLTTFEARAELDIPHPAGRINELRAQGYNILTHWETVGTENNKHRIAKYVLFAGAAND